MIFYINDYKVDTNKGKKLFGIDHMYNGNYSYTEEVLLFNNDDIDFPVFVLYTCGLQDKSSVTMFDSARDAYEYVTEHMQPFTEEEAEHMEKYFSDMYTEL